MISIRIPACQDLAAGHFFPGWKVAWVQRTRWNSTRTGRDAVSYLFVTCRNATKTVLTSDPRNRNNFRNTSKCSKEFLEMALPKNIQYNSTKTGLSDVRHLPNICYLCGPWGRIVGHSKIFVITSKKNIHERTTFSFGHCLNQLYPTLFSYRCLP